MQKISNVLKKHDIHEFWILIKKILYNTWIEIKEAQLFMNASSLAYTTILSLIPLLAVSFAIFKAFGGLERMVGTLEPFLLNNLAEGTSDDVIQRIREYIANAHASAVGAGGFIGLVLTSMSMLSNIEKAINRVWRVNGVRPLFQRISSYWLFVTLGPVALAVVLGATTTSEVSIVRFLPSGTGVFFMMVGIFFCVYRYVPHCEVRWPFALIGAFFTSICWNLARMAYSLYTKNVVSYDKIYGSLGAVPILLLWIFIVWVVILTGAAFSAALQKTIPKK